MVASGWGGGKLGLAWLWCKPTGPYLRKEVPTDPWSQPYIYLSPGDKNPTSYDVLTLGRDGQPGGEGANADVTSWE